MNGNNVKTPTIHNKTLSRKAKKNIYIAVMLFIPVAHFIIFWGVVNFNSILMAFQKLNIDTGGTDWTFNNFITIWQDLKYWGNYGGLQESLENTVYTFLFLTIFMLPWAFIVTYFLHKKIRLTGLWRFMLLLPSILPAVAMTSIFKFLIYPQGPVGKFWQLFGAAAPQFLAKEKTARWTVLVYMLWANFGGQFMLFSGAMAKVPKEVVESAYLDGAGMRTELLRIILPLCWPTISMLLLLNLAGFFMSSGPVLLLTQGQKQTMTVSFWIFSWVNDSRLLEVPAALGVACTVILFPVVLLARWGLGKVYADVEF